MKYFILVLNFILFFTFLHPVMGEEPKPNELGKIMVITYHVIGDKDTAYTRTISGFKEDLASFKKEGFYPIKLSDFEKRIIKAPKGKKPLLITFDDSSKSQFEMDADGNIKADCAVGIMEDFKKKNPDFPMNATFFILPGAKSPNNLFGQPDLTKRKIEFLIKNGYEIANHTLWHANLKKYKDKIEEQIVESQILLNKYAPDLVMTSFAVPFGIYPPKSMEHKLLSGKYKDKTYKHKLVFDYSNRMSVSPYDTEFDNLHVRRVQAFDGNIQNFIKKIQKDPEMPFISDGDPETITFPKRLESKFRKAFSKKFKVVAYE